MAARSSRRSVRGHGCGASNLRQPEYAMDKRRSGATKKKVDGPYRDPILGTAHSRQKRHPGKCIKERRTSGEESFTARMLASMIRLSSQTFSMYMTCTPRASNLLRMSCRAVLVPFCLWHRADESVVPRPDQSIHKHSHRISRTGRSRTASASERWHGGKKKPQLVPTSQRNI
jgi:hypothetical protein